MYKSKWQRIIQSITYPPACKSHCSCWRPELLSF